MPRQALKASSPGPPIQKNPSPDLAILIIRSSIRRERSMKPYMRRARSAGRLSAPVAISPTPAGWLLAPAGGGSRRRVGTPLFSAGPLFFAMVSPRRTAGLSAGGDGERTPHGRGTFTVILAHAGRENQLNSHSGESGGSGKWRWVVSGEW